MSKIYKGFTLIELLVVIGILGILLTIVLIAINPAAQFAQANNTKRSADVLTILNAIHQYAVDHKGTLPTGMPASGAAAETIASGAGNADICAVVNPDYVAGLPTDPKTGSANGVTGASATDCTQAYDTGYTVSVDTNGRVTITATAEAVRGVTPTITVTR